MAKVSTATVSRVFANDDCVRQKTKIRVLEAAKQLGYFPNLQARSFKKSKSRMIGLLLDESDNIFYSILIKYIERKVNSYGYRVLLTFSNESASLERNCLEILLSSRVEGIIYMPVSIENEDIINQIKTTNIPILQCFRKCYDGLNTFSVRDEIGTYIATKHLLENGHTNILITDYGSIDINSPKIKGYLDAFQDFNLTPDKNNIIKIKSVNESNERILKAITKRKATAIITLNSIMTASALNVFNQLRLKIPDDISMIAYDDSDWLSFLNISAISHPMELMGNKITEIIFDMLKQKEDGIDQQKFNIQEEVDPSLIIRKSVKNIK